MGKHAWLSNTEIAEQYEITQLAYNDYTTFYNAINVVPFSPMTGPAILRRTLESDALLTIILDKLKLDSEADSLEQFYYRSMFRDFNQGFPDFGPILVEYYLLPETNKLNDLDHLIIKFICTTLWMSAGYGIKMLRTWYTGPRMQNILEEAQLNYPELISKTWDELIKTLRKASVITETDNPSVHIKQLRTYLLELVKNSTFGSLENPPTAGAEFETTVQDLFMDALGINSNSYDAKLAEMNYWKTGQVPTERTWESLDFKLKWEKYASHEFFQHLTNGIDVDLEIKSKNRELSRAQQLTCEKRRRKGEHYLLLWSNHIECIACASEAFDWIAIVEKLAPKAFQLNQVVYKNLQKDINCGDGFKCEKRSSGCPYRHPVACKFGKYCSRSGCHFVHGIQCKFGPKCRYLSSCKFMHH